MITNTRLTSRAASLAAVALLAVGCGGSSNSADDQAQNQPAAASPSVTQATNATPTAVSISTFAFSPERLQVKVGQTVTWTNEDDILHTVTSGTRQYDPTNSGLVTATNKDGLFDVPLDAKGATAQHTFNKAGTFHYFCDRHPGMEADIEVS